MKLSDIVDFEPIKKKLSKKKDKEIIERTIECVFPSEDLDLNYALWGIDCEKYINASNEEMINFLYQRLVPAHQLERGMLALIYAINQNLQTNQFRKNRNGVYQSSGMITMQSCIGHLLTEPQTGIDIGILKRPFIQFFSVNEIASSNRRKYQSLLKTFKKTPYYNPTPKVTLTELKSPIKDIQTFWHDIIKIINQYNKQVSIDPAIVIEAIRPDYLIHDRLDQNIF